MTDKKPRHRSRLFYIIISILAVLIAAGFFFWRDFKYRLVDQKLQNAVDTKSNGLYSLAYKNLVIDEVAGNISAEALSLIPDTIVFNAQRKAGTAPPVMLDLRVPKLTIEGVKTPKALLDKEISGHRLVISDPVIEVSMNNYLRDTSNYSVGQELYKQILGKLVSIKIDSILLTNASIVIKNMTTGKVDFRGTGFSFELSNIQIDSLHQNDSSRIFFAKDIHVFTKEFVLPSKDNQYHYIFHDMDYNSSLKMFTAGSVKVSPQESEAAFAKSHRFSMDRYDFGLKGIRLVNINHLALLRKSLIADSLLISESSFKIFRDISNPHDSIDRTMAYPQQQWIKLPLPFDIKKLLLAHSFIEYKEKNAKSDSSGKVQFYDVRAVFSNLTNMPSLIRANNKAVLDFKSRFLNKAPVTAKLTMYMKDTAGRFTLMANMGSMDAASLNPMIQPMALARLDKGNIRSLHLNMQADFHHADASLLLLYSDLKITLLKKDDDKNIYKKKLLPSLAAAILIKDSNPAHGETRTSAVHYKRDVYRSMFNLMWKTLFTGVKETAGMK